MKKIPFVASLLTLCAPLFSRAHEVYVLDQTTIDAAMAAPSPNPFLAYIGNEYTFFFYAAVAVVVVATIVFATVFRVFEKGLGPILMRLKRFAIPIVRITMGLSILSFGLAGALYGTEIPFDRVFGGLSTFMQVFFVLCGVSVVLGAYTRYIAVIMAAIYVYAGVLYGTYIFTYTDHIGGFIFLAILGSGEWSINHRFKIGQGHRIEALRKWTPLAFPALRIFFGFGIMFASIYAKFLHSQLALEVVIQYNLTNYFPFDPLFVVLGALIVEFIAGVMFVFGIAVRWTALFLLFWLTLSLLYFQEAVWPHIILFGICFALFCHGYDRFSLEGYYLKKGHSEPLM